MSKKQKRTQQRQASGHTASASSAKPIVAAVGVGVVILLVAVVVFSRTPLRGVPDGSETVAVGPPQHVEGDIHLEGEVPAGGPHDAVWQNCGFYDRPVRSENAVHSLEHGAVWVSYDSGLSEDEIKRLRGFSGVGDKVLISPVADQAAPIIATAWANQLELDDVDDPRLEQFVNEFEGSLDAPEPGGACTGGIGNPVA